MRLIRDPKGTFRQWLRHLDHSPYCSGRYPGTFNGQGNESCPCGWQSTPEPTPPCCLSWPFCECWLEEGSDKEGQEENASV